MTGALARYTLAETNRETRSATPLREVGDADGAPVVVKLVGPRMEPIVQEFAARAERLTGIVVCPAALGVVANARLEPDDEPLAQRLPERDRQLEDRPLTTMAERYMSQVA